MKKDILSNRRKLHSIVFESETTAGKTFDIILLILILASVIIVSLETVTYLRRAYLPLFQKLEWAFTILFTLEYLLRIYSSPRPLKYIFSFFGLVDLFSIIPTYLSLFVIGAQYFLIVRVLRLLRIARIFKLTHFINEGKVLTRALQASFTKIAVFLGTVLLLVVIIGSMMFVIEGAASGFTSIPKSIYWTIVTLTTVGYGDIAPQTPLGQILASCVMIMGYGIIAVPTGIVTVEMTRSEKQLTNSEVCPNCQLVGHVPGAKYCYNCGYLLNESA
ncbi:ion transporter [Pontibacter fetidus]|uniref:Ion transporter n=1 Tax=Pontibacter fetidus TaxID=2700082 RepID=A0A6B2H1Y8_9BACT|nr:ion transporter [Pontibacter fetidus]NDK56333.1 ion transporter [Pontibacter fetidus]